MGSLVEEKKETELDTISQKNQVSYWPVQVVKDHPWVCGLSALTLTAVVLGISNPERAKLGVDKSLNWMQDNMTITGLFFFVLFWLLLIGYLRMQDKPGLAPSLPGLSV